MNASERWHRDHERVLREVREYLAELDHARDDTIDQDDDEECRAS